VELVHVTKGEEGQLLKKDMDRLPASGRSPTQGALKGGGSIMNTLSATCSSLDPRLSYTA